MGSPKKHLNDSIIELNILSCYRVFWIHLTNCLPSLGKYAEYFPPFFKKGGSIRVSRSTC